MPFNLGLPEMLLIAFLAILFFGREQLTGLSKDLANSIKTFKRELTEVEEKVSISKEDLALTPRKKAKKQA